MDSVILLCTGNLCRSVMAQGLLSARLSERGQPVPVASAGLLGGGRPPPAEVVSVMAGRGIDVAAHRSRQVTAADLEAAGLILGLTREHVRHAAVLLPGAWPRTFTLRELVRLGRQAGPGPRPSRCPPGWTGPPPPAATATCSATARRTTWPTPTAARWPATRRPRTCSTRSPPTSPRSAGASGRRPGSPGTRSGGKSLKACPPNGCGLRPGLTGRGPRCRSAPGAAPGRAAARAAPPWRTRPAGGAARHRPRPARGCQARPGRAA